VAYRTSSPPRTALDDVTRDRSRLVLPALLGATVIGTLSNNILNVPLRDITDGFGASVSSGVLVVSSFVLVLAAAMPLTGWIGDRFGRKRTLVVALLIMTAAQFGAAIAPSLGVLVGIRALQGLAGSAIPPTVMGMLADLYPLHRRSRMIGLWAAANGAAQAIGPPVGGVLAAWWGWRSIFWLLGPLTAFVLVFARALPGGRRHQPAPLHWPGAVSVTLGATLLMVCATLIPQRAVPVWLDASLGGVGLGCLAAFVALSSRAEHPIIAPRLLIEARFLRSTIAIFAQMFALICVLVAVPLYLTGTLGQSTAAAGLLFFVLPAAMALLAPVVGAISDRLGPRRVMRTGLAVLALASLGIGAFTEVDARGLGVLCLLLVVVGVGVALVQTPSATGATRSPAGAKGPALGLFNMMRFGGSAFGAAWVAVLYPRGALLALFAGAAVLLGLALALSFAGSDPDPSFAGSDPDPSPAAGAG
jgi:MFS family permease